MQKCQIKENTVKSDSSLLDDSIVGLLMRRFYHRLGHLKLII